MNNIADLRSKYKSPESRSFRNAGDLIFLLLWEAEEADPSSIKTRAVELGSDGVDLDSSDGMDDTALIYSISHKRFDLADALLYAGALVSPKSSYQGNALYYLATNSRDIGLSADEKERCCRLLISYGGLISEKIQQGAHLPAQSAIALASEHDPDLAKIFGGMKFLGPTKLFEKPVSEDCNKRLSNGWPCICYFAKMRWLDCVELCIDAGSDLNITAPNTGSNALHLLLSQPKTPQHILDKLISNGCSLGKKNSKGKTPRDIGLQNGYLDLLSAGEISAPIEAKDNPSVPRLAKSDTKPSTLWWKIWKK